MSRQKIEHKNIRKLSKVGAGKTYSVTLPVGAIRAFGWKQKQKVVIEVDFKAKRFIVKDWKK